MANLVTARNDAGRINNSSASWRGFAWKFHKDRCTQIVSPVQKLVQERFRNQSRVLETQKHHLHRADGGGGLSAIALHPSHRICTRIDGAKKGKTSRSRPLPRLRDLFLPPRVAGSETSLSNHLATRFVCWPAWPKLPGQMKHAAIKNDPAKCGKTFHKLYVFCFRREKVHAPSTRDSQLLRPFVVSSLESLKQELRKQRMWDVSIPGGALRRAAARDASLDDIQRATAALSH